jgi:NAD dependent epimerase/dehydratase
MVIKNKRVLVTGADGFIGSHLCQALVHAEAKVKAFCLYNSFNSWGWLDTVDKNELKQIEVFSGDIRDPNAVRSAMKDVDVVFHLAALIAIPYSYYSPDSYIETNIRGTLNILQAAREQSVEKILVTSTSEVYGTAKYVPIDELHPKQPQSPYSATKISADCMAESFFRSFNLPVTIVRPFNTYGPRQSARAVIPTIITQLLSGQTEIKLGDLYPTRDLLYVNDTVSAFIEIAKADTLNGEEINIATATEISIGDLANILVKKINPSAKIRHDEKRMRPEKSEVYRLLGDNRKILQHTNWTPEFSLEEGLNLTIEWFSDSRNLSRYKSEIYNV